jgi:hypothetical protein
MRQAYHRRPQDFRRRILKKITTNRRDVFFEEQRWLDMIHKDEFGKKYYNILKRTPKNGKGIREKVILTCVVCQQQFQRDVYRPKYTNSFCCQQHYQIYKKNNGSSFKGRTHTEEAKEKNRQAHWGIKHSNERKQQISLHLKQIWQLRREGKLPMPDQDYKNNPKYRMAIANTMKVRRAERIHT